MKRFVAWVSFLLVMLGSGSLFVNADSEAAELSAYSAVYSARIGKVRLAGGSLFDAQGVFTTALEKMCEGWVMSQNLSMDLLAPDGRTMPQSISYSGWENLKGSSYRFVSRNFVGDEEEDIRGSARMVGNGASGEAVFQQPVSKRVALPKGTFFPIAHLAWLIDRAGAGDSRVPGSIFYGVDGNGPQEVTAFIGPKIKAAGQRWNRFGVLTDRPGWTMRLAYFSPDSTRSLPEVEVDMVQLDNGVTPHMEFDYGVFTVILDLEELTPLSNPTC